MTHAQTIALYQPLLHTIAYNLVRCRQDAEDIVQDTFARWLTVDLHKIENTKAYLIRAVTNNCLTHLQSLRKKKEQYMDSIRLGEVFTKFKEMNLASLDLDVNLEAAFAILHTKLEPLERAVFVLKEGFDFSYDELQETLNKKKDYCRQLVSRARKKISEEAGKIQFDMPSASDMLTRFKNACKMDQAADYVQALKHEIQTVLKKKI